MTFKGEGSFAARAAEQRERARSPAAGPPAWMLKAKPLPRSPLMTNRCAPRRLPKIKAPF